MAREIIAKTYHYETDKDGKVKRVGEIEQQVCEQKSWNKLQNDLINGAKGQDGNFVKLKKYQTVRIPVSAKIDYLYKKGEKGSFTKTYYSSRKTTD